MDSFFKKINHIIDRTVETNNIERKEEFDMSSQNKKPLNLDFINQWIQDNQKAADTIRNMPLEKFIQCKKQIAHDYEANAAKMTALRDMYANEFECVEKLSRE